MSVPNVCGRSAPIVAVTAAEMIHIWAPVCELLQLPVCRIENAVAQMSAPVSREDPKSNGHFGSHGYINGEEERVAIPESVNT